MKKNVLFIALFLVSTLSVAQKQDFQWLYGYNSQFSEPTGGCILDFNYEPPILYEQERDLNFDVTVTSTCDIEGNLLFYSNGINIHNHLGVLVENGDSLNPSLVANEFFNQGYPILQSITTLESPLDFNIYHIFHIMGDYHPTLGAARTALYLTKIDMNQNNGLGKVISKNEEILTDQNLGTITAVKHGNGRDWWVFVTQLGINKYYRILLSPTGITELEEISILPNFEPLLTDGGITFSPDGQKFIRYEIEHGAYIYDFDRCSGEFSNPIFLPLPDTNWGGGASFSPSCRFLYLTSTVYVFQYDLWEDDIGSSIDTVAIYDGFYSPAPPFATTFFMSQLGPDGRIYINNTNNTDVLHVINYPNKKGNLCQVLQHGVQLPTRNRFSTQHFPNYRLSSLDSSPCDTLNLNNLPLAGFRYEADTINPFLIEFTDNSFYEPTDWLWDFDDNGAMSTEVNPLHEFSENGIYEVCLTVSNQYSSNTFCREVEVILNDATNIVVPDFEVFIYPNPIQNEFTVFSSEYLKEDAIVIFYNQLGQQVTNFSMKKGQQVHNFAMESVANGIYFYSVFQKEQLVGNGKVVVGRE